MTGSGALRGCGTKLAVLLVLVVLFLYLVLPLVLESLIASKVQTALEGTAFERPTKPDVEVSSNFPPMMPMMLLGRIDRVEVTIDQNSRAVVKGVRVSVPSLIAGNPAYETKSCSIFSNQTQSKCPNYLRHR